MSINQNYHLLNTTSSAEIIDALDVYITEHRKSRIDKVLSGRLNTIHLAIEAPSDINNALAAIRTSEALGLAKVHIIKPEGSVNDIRRITQGAIYWVDVCFYDSVKDFLEMIQDHNIKLAGGVMSGNLKISEVPVVEALCILIGNEHRGLSQLVSQSCDILYKIPMYGMTESFNLSVSAAISLFDVTERKRASLHANTDLTAAQFIELKAKYYISSVAPRLVTATLKRFGL